ncbi:MAG: hypothetical protein KUF75_11520 [Candidatus Thiodiazotropha sp. (ex Ctena orbiculata)]|nr:hypothetical protein [Candidatus Thiodiazotropha taylori]
MSISRCGTTAESVLLLVLADVTAGETATNTPKGVVSVLKAIELLRKPAVTGLPLHNATATPRRLRVEEVRAGARRRR